MSAAALERCRRARADGFAVDWQGAPALGALLVTGADAPAFLQAQLTSDVAALAPGAGQLSARLDRRGALVAWFSLHRLPDQGQPFPSYLAVLPRAEVPGLAGDLARHVITEHVLLEDASDAFDGLLVHRPAAAPDDPAPFAVRTEPEGWTVARSFTGDPGLLRLVPRGRALARPEDLAVWPDDPDAATAWRWLRVEAGWPQMGIDLAPAAAPLAQTGLEDHVASATKGCYLGQEVVARLRTYGSVPRALRGIVLRDLPGDVLPSLGAPGQDLVDAAGAKIGTWASGGLSIAWERPVALAFLDRTHRTPGSELSLRLADGTHAAAEVVLLPFHSATDAADRARRLHERAVHAFSRGRDEEAVGLLGEALRLDPSLAEAYEALGVILGRGERFHEAIAVFRRLEEVAPREPMVHTNLSRFYMRLGDKEEAERQLALATEKRFAGFDDDRARARQEAEDAAARLAEAERKAAMFAEVLALDGDDPLALMGLGGALAELDRFAEAEPHLARACAVQRDNSAAFAAHGRVLERLGRDEDAAAVYRRGVEVASRKGDLMPLREMEHRLLLLAGGV